MDINDEQFENISFIVVTFFVFHLDISGKCDNEEQPQNILFIFITLIVFHLDISGKDNNDLQ